MKARDKVYHEILEHVLLLLSKKHSIEMIAGCLMVIAQRLYKTHLSKEDYDRAMKNEMPDLWWKTYQKLT